MLLHTWLPPPMVLSFYREWTMLRVLEVSLTRAGHNGWVIQITSLLLTFLLTLFFSEVCLEKASIGWWGFQWDCVYRTSKPSLLKFVSTTSYFYRSLNLESGCAVGSPIPICSNPTFDEHNNWTGRDSRSCTEEVILGWAAISDKPRNQWLRLQLHIGKLIDESWISWCLRLPHLPSFQAQSVSNSLQIEL